MVTLREFHLQKDLSPFLSKFSSQFCLSCVITTEKPFVSCMLSRKPPRPVTDDSFEMFSLNFPNFSFEILLNNYCLNSKPP